MTSLRSIFVVLAVVCFILAAFPMPLPVRFEWLGAACLTLAWLT